MGLLALSGCDFSPPPPKDPMTECMEICTVNVGLCQQGCANDAECKRSCAKANETCTTSCTQKSQKK